MNVKDKQRMKALADKYYSGETSTEEEHELRILLAQDNDTADAAVAGYFAALRKKKNCSKHGLRFSLLRTACTLAISIATCTALYFVAAYDHREECVAYINGVEATDSDAALSIMLMQLKEMSEMSDTANDEMMKAINDFSMSMQ